MVSDHSGGRVTGRRKMFWMLWGIMGVVSVAGFAQTSGDPLQYHFPLGYGQVEVGGPFVGAEFHDSRPLPSRISFYSPVANSIDLSTDYWKRGDSRPMAVGLCIDGRDPRWIGRDAWEYILSPHRVSFLHAMDSVDCSLTYEFGLHEPIMTLRMRFLNTGKAEHHIEAYYHLKTTLRTCQTYARFDTASMFYDENTDAVIARFPQPQTDEAAVFIQNEAERPTGWALDARELAITDSGTSRWSGKTIPRATSALKPIPGCAAFTYDRAVAPGDSLVVVLVIGSCENAEAAGMVKLMPKLWSDDVKAYDRYVRAHSVFRPVIRTGDPWVDRSAIWARAILASNAHYLDGEIVPMPCPAEYNFFFTHDMLLTDLAAVAFDPHRVKKDLLSLASHARDSVIPHAYYWRDDGFKTEYCPPDDWNHLWFVLAAATYLRHTMDTTVVERLYPLLTKSMADARRRLGKDHLMYAAAPDWWDIGKDAGPRSYMTVLVIRALRDYTFISAVLKKRDHNLEKLEATARLMQESLPKRLWDDKVKYLMNENGGREDTHLYMGSLLAPVFGVLDTVRSRELVSTAERVLLAPGVGIRTVMPADFHTDSLRAAFHFAGNEAGDPYLYANGGVWPHDNAWYALALRSVGRVDDAFKFYRSTMTLDGVTNSPKGQPAFYEYRFSDTSSPEYGKIDKPSFLWAAGFTLYTAYRLLGFDENVWNLSLSRSLPTAIDTASCSYEFWREKKVKVSRAAVGFTADGMSIPSRVIPLSCRASKAWTVGFSSETTPCLESVNAVLESVEYDPGKRNLSFSIRSFKGHSVVAEVTSGAIPRQALVEGRKVSKIDHQDLSSGQVMTKIEFSGKDGAQRVVFEF